MHNKAASVAVAKNVVVKKKCFERKHGFSLPRATSVHRENKEGSCHRKNENENENEKEKEEGSRTEETDTHAHGRCSALGNSSAKHASTHRTRPVQNQTQLHR